MKTFLTLGVLFGLWSLSALARGVAAATAVLLMCAAACAEPVKVCPTNPHYLMFKGKPVVLITSDHHYGAVMDRDFDFSSYLNYLGRHRMNLTRNGYGLVKPYTVDDVRVEGWWFMLGGGAGFIHLNGEYYRGQETGGPDTQTRIVPEKMILRDFMESLDLVGLRRFTGLGGIPAGAIASAIAEPGRQYAVYLFHGKNDGQWGAHYGVTPGKFEDTLTLISVPAGQYGLQWIEPATGKVMRTETKTHSGGTFRVATPPYTVDVALRMRRAAAPAK